MRAAICGLSGIELETRSASERVARAVRGVEAHVVRAEAADQRVHLVRVAEVERRVRASAASTRASVSGRREVACTASHLSTTSGSSLPFGVEALERRLARRRSREFASAASAAIASVMLSAAVELLGAERAVVGSSSSIR